MTVGRGAIILGLGLLGIVWLGSLPELAKHSFAAHMGMHVLVVAVAAPLLAIGAAGGRFDPARGAPAVFLPVPASIVELIVVWAWHAPALHHVARQSTAMLVFEQASFLIAGLLVWFAAFGGKKAGLEQGRERAAAGIAGLLLTSMHMTLLGVLLALASRPLYLHGDVTTLGLTPMQDQHLGGVLMLIFGGTTYLAGGLYLLAGLLREDRDVAPAG
jgi:putative membrane protein